MVLQRRCEARDAPTPDQHEDIAARAKTERRYRQMQPGSMLDLFAEADRLTGGRQHRTECEWPSHK
jgi:hypothetical protein